MWKILLRRKMWNGAQEKTREQELESTSFMLWKEEFMASKENLLNPNMDIEDQLNSAWRGVSKAVKHKWRSEAGTYIKQSINKSTKIMTIPKKAVSPVIDRPSSSSSMKKTNVDSRAEQLDSISFKLWSEDFLKTNYSQLVPSLNVQVQLISRWKNVKASEKQKWRTEAGVHLKRMEKNGEVNATASAVPRQILKSLEKPISNVNGIIATTPRSSTSLSLSPQKIIENESKSEQLDLMSFELWRNDFLETNPYLIDPSVNPQIELMSRWQNLSKMEKLTWRSQAGPLLKGAEKNAQRESDKLGVTTIMLWKKDFLQSKRKKLRLDPTKDTDEQLDALWLHVSKQEKLNWRSKAGGHLKLMAKAKMARKSSPVVRVQVPTPKPPVNTVQLQAQAPISVFCPHAIVSPVIPTLDERDARLESVSMMLWKEEYFTRNHLDPNLFTEDQIEASWNVISPREKLDWRSKAGGYLKKHKNAGLSVSPRDNIQIKVPAPVAAPSPLPSTSQSLLQGQSLDMAERKAKLDSISFELWKNNFIKTMGHLLDLKLGRDGQLLYLWGSVNEEEKHKWRSAAGCHLSEIEKNPNMTKVMATTPSNSISIPNGTHTPLIYAQKPLTRTSSCSSLVSSVQSYGLSEKMKMDLDQATYELWRTNFLDKNPDVEHKNSVFVLTSEWKNLTYGEKQRWRNLAEAHMEEGTEPVMNGKRVRGAHRRDTYTAKDRRSVVLEIEKPQGKFKFPPDNSTGPFVPFLKLKLNPLTKSLSVFTPVPITKKDGTIYYEHPYKEELNAFKPDDFQMSEVKIPQVPPKLEVTPFTLVTTHDQVFEMLEHLKTVKEIAVDVEHHDTRTFLGLTCLIQISTRTNDYVIDGLSPELFKNLECLNFVFTNPRITKVLHGAASDIEWLQRDFGLYIVGMFDTCIAGEFLHGKQKSLKFLLETYAKVTDVDKMYQCADWRVRPLPDDMVHYARVDTHYLLYVYDILKNLVLKSGNLSDVFERSRDRCLIRYEKPTNDPIPSLEKMKKPMSERQCYAYMELFKWRDSIARERDESTQYILTNKLLEILAQTLQSDETSITEILESRCNDTIPPIVRENMNQVVGIIKKALTIPDTEKEGGMENAMKSLSSSFASLALTDKTEFGIGYFGKESEGFGPGSDGTSFRTLPVIPKLGELFSPSNNFLRKNIIVGPYENTEHYLDVQFRLLREDFLRSVKEGLKGYMARKKSHTGIRVHSCIKLIGKTANSCKLQLSKDLFRRVCSEDTKRFIPGSLLLFTKDNFKTTHLGLICHDKRDLEETRGEFTVQMRGEASIRTLPWGVGEQFVTIECDAYFEPYRSVMTVMKQNNWLQRTPLWKYLKNGRGAPTVPKYLRNKTLNIGRVKVKSDDLSTWPQPEDLGLDIAQFKAYQAALTQEFVVVQGPPGTGKTYLGLQIIKTLMEAENVAKWRDNGGGPIIIVCYTNHALDQFGDGILDLFTPPEHKDSKTTYKVSHPRLIRLGRGCQSPRLLDYQPLNSNWKGNQVDIVLMTTTGAAIRSHKLMNLRSRILIVEEAAEVVEQHVIGCLAPSIQQLILLGDHQQLRPITASSELTNEYNMDVSLFERMVKNDFPRYQLEVQHRMRPQIRDLITGTIYPKLLDHPRVHNYPSVAGMAHSLYFVDHREPETEPTEDSTSRSNEHETKFLGALCEYLLQQGYEEERITVLGMYMKQVKQLESEIWGKRHISKNLRIETADSFQGEENDIILLSLVRSNRKNNIGFMKTDNRICVALSRAKHGLYIIGNMELLAANSRTWNQINLKLISKGRIGPKLLLECDKHDNKVRTEVVKERDFFNITHNGCHICNKLRDEAVRRQKALDASKKSSRRKRNRRTACTYYNPLYPVD